ncbi:MAG TPA: NUDIX hydrolase [Polyangia bacterium]|nr:NUDIX hydrolase [Polyangia bacterium]
MADAWQRRGKRRVLDTKIFGIDAHALVHPRTGREHEFWIVDAPDWCNIVPLTRAGEVVMVRQQRHGIGSETLELPGGMIDPTDASPLEAARRELLEETGYRATELVPTGVIAPNPAMQTNRCWSFLARDVELVAAPALDGGEDIDVVLVPYAEIPARVAAGEISHALVVVAFAYALGLRGPT